MNYVKEIMNYWNLLFFNLKIKFIINLFIQNADNTSSLNPESKYFWFHLSILKKTS